MQREETIVGHAKTQLKKPNALMPNDAALHQRFLALVLSNPINTAILERLPLLGVAQAWLVAGCLYDAVWNAHAGWPADHGVNDYDIFYFDPSDLSYAAEDRIIQRGRVLFADLGVTVEIRNQARVHLWYPIRFGENYPPSTSSKHAMSRFLLRCTCVGLRQAWGGGYDIHAPFGLADLFLGRLRPNLSVGSDATRQGKAASYIARWPWLEFQDDTSPCGR